GRQMRTTPGWKETKSFTMVGEYYRKYLRDCRPQIFGIMTAVIDNPSATVFHCYAGKDRTGVIAALLLGAVGVPDSVIADDYGETRHHLPDFIRKWREEAARDGRNRDGVERDAGAEPQTMLEIMGELRQQHGSISEYLYQCGISREQLALLRE